MCGVGREPGEHAPSYYGSDYEPPSYSPQVVRESVFSRITDDSCYNKRNVQSALLKWQVMSFVKAVFIELVRGCDNPSCNSPCPAFGQPIFVMEKDKLEKTLQILDSWVVKENWRPWNCVLYGYGDSTDLPYHLGDIEDQFSHLFLETILTHDYGRLSSPQKGLAGKITYYCRLFSVKDVEDYLAIESDVLHYPLIVASKDMRLEAMFKTFAERKFFKNIFVKKMDHAGENSVSLPECLEIIHCVSDKARITKIEFGDRETRGITPVVENVDDKFIHFRRCFNINSQKFSICHKAEDAFWQWAWHLLRSMELSGSNLVSRNCEDLCGFGTRWEAIVAFS